jgi:hypothetical protein
MSVSEKVETTANLATICVAVLLSAVLVRAYLLPPRGVRPQAAEAETIVGTDMRSRLPGENWSRNGRTLVLAISTQCHFCRESSPFYRRLQQQAAKSIKVMAVLPQAVPAAEEYLKTEGVQVNEVRQVPLATIGVRGTPTMLLVNGKGVVEKVWVGKLQPEEENSVLSSVGRG